MRPQHMLSALFFKRRKSLSNTQTLFTSRAPYFQYLLSIRVWNDFLCLFLAADEFDDQSIHIGLHSRAPIANKKRIAQAATV